MSLGNDAFGQGDRQKESWVLKMDLEELKAILQVAGLIPLTHANHFQISTRPCTFYSKRTPHFTAPTQPQLFSDYK